MKKKIRRRAALLCAAALMLQQFTPAGRYSVFHAEAGMDPEQLEAWEETEEFEESGGEIIPEEAPAQDVLPETETASETELKKEEEGISDESQQEAEYAETEKTVMADEKEASFDLPEEHAEENPAENAFSETEPDENSGGEINSTDPDTGNQAVLSGDGISSDEPGSEAVERMEPETAPAAHAEPDDPEITEDHTGSGPETEHLETETVKTEDHEEKTELDYADAFLQVSAYCIDGRSFDREDELSVVYDSDQNALKRAVMAWFSGNDRKYVSMPVFSVTVTDADGNVKEDVLVELMIKDERILDAMKKEGVLYACMHDPENTLMIDTSTDYSYADGSLTAKFPGSRNIHSMLVCEPDRETESMPEEVMTETESIPEEEMTETESIPEETVTETEEQGGTFHKIISDSDLYQVVTPDGKEDFQAGDYVSASVIPAEGYAVDSVSVLRSEDGDLLQHSENTAQSAVSYLFAKPAAFEYEIEEEPDGSCRVNVPDGLSVGQEIRFIMPEEDVIVSAAAVLLADSDVAQILFTSTGEYRYGPDGINEYEEALSDYFYTTMTLEDGTVKKTDAHCLEHLKHNPAEISDAPFTEGSGEGTFTLLKDSNAVTRGLFYLYGGPGWGKEIEGKDGKIYNIKQMMNQLCANDEQCYAMTHYILCYLYNPDPINWNCHWDYSLNRRVEGRFTAEGRDFITSIGDAVKQLPSPVVKLSKSSAGSTYDIGQGLQRSSSVTYHSFTDNNGKISLPSGVTLVNETSGRSFTGKAVLTDGDKFHLERASSVEETVEYTIKPSLGVDFQAVRLNLPEEYQVIGASYFQKGSLSLAVKWEGQPEGYVYLQKRSSNTAVTQNNSMYSLEGAVFTLTHSLNEELQYTLTTKADGTTGTVRVPAGTYHVKETAAPKGYLTCQEIPDVTVDASNTKDSPAQIKVEDVPVTGSFTLDLIKAAGSATNRTTAGAVFEIRHFGSIPESGSPLRTWTYISTDTGQNDSSSRIPTEKAPSSGTAYTSGGGIVFPLGTYVVTEKTAPSGFVKSGKSYTITISQSGDHTAASYSGFDSNSSHSISNAALINNEGTFGKVRIRKSDSQNGTQSQGDASLAGAVFAVISRNDYTVTAKSSPGTAVSKGQTVSKITTGADGIGESELIQSGEYLIREITAPTGCLLGDLDLPVEIPDIDGTVVDLTADLSDSYPDEVIRGGFHLEKQDLELTLNACESGGNGSFQKDHFFGDNPAQGDASLAGAGFELYNRSAKPVCVNGQSYASGAKIMSFETDVNGTYTSPAGLLPYGTYLVRETSAPEGYTMRGKNHEITFRIREQEEIVDLGGSENVTKESENVCVLDEVIRFDFDIYKFAGPEDEAYTVSEDPSDTIRGLEGVRFDLFLVSAGPENPGPYLSIVTDEDGYATTRDLSAYPHGRLPYGIYRVHEAEETVPEGFAAIEDFYIDGTLANGVYDGKLYTRKQYKTDTPAGEFTVLVKTDSETGKVVPAEGIIFQLYKDRPKNQGGTLVTYHDLSKHKVVDTFVTDESGMVHIPQRMPYGTYYLHEVQAPDGYFWQKDVRFTVTTRNSWEAVLERQIADEPAKGIIHIQKKDSETGEGLGGVVFGLYAAEDIITGEGTVRHRRHEKVDEIVTDETGTGSSGEHYCGSYYVKELSVPEGYALDPEEYPCSLAYDSGMGSENMETRDRSRLFSDGGYLAEVTVEAENFPTELLLFKAEKTAADGDGGTEKETGTHQAGKGLDGITFFIDQTEKGSKDRPDHPLAWTGGTVTTTDGGRIRIPHIAGGLYRITETGTLPGYIPDPVPRYFIVNEDGWIAECDENGKTDQEPQKLLKLFWENDYTKWSFSKQTMGGEEIPGALITICHAPGSGSGKDGKVAVTADGVLCTWTSTDTPHRIDRLPEGDYVMHEEIAAKGYAIASDLPFTVTSTGVLCHLKMTDKRVLVHKTDVMGEEVPGAKLCVYELDGTGENAGTAGKKVDSWVSTKTPHAVENLCAGRSYRLVEEAAASGYVLRQSVDFTVADDGVDQNVTLVNQQVLVSKKEIAGGPEIAGARLTVTEKDTGRILDSWISEKTPHAVENLETGKSYILTETIPAKGYASAEQIEFMVTDNGVNAEITMEDQPIRVMVSKKDLTKGSKGSGISGAELEIRNEKGTVVEKWTSGPDPHLIEKLPVGKYTLTETAAPDGYEVSESVPFEVLDTGEIQTVIMYDAPKREVELSKQELGKAGKELPGAEMTLKDENGKVIDKWTSGRKPHKLKLSSGTYTLIEKTAPDGYATAEQITFQVKRTAKGDYKIQKVVMKDAPTKLRIIKTDLTDAKPVVGAVLEIRDRKGRCMEKWTTTGKPHTIRKIPVGKYTLTEITAPDGYEKAETVSFEVKDTPKLQKVEMKDKPAPEEKPTEKEKEKPGSPSGSGGGVSGNGGNGAPATGDQTNVVPPLLAMAVSLAVIALVMRRRRREE